MSEATAQCFEYIFLKFSCKHQCCSPNISKIFNWPLENWFSNRQYTTHIGQLLKTLITCFVLIWTRIKLTTKGSSAAVSLCRDLFLFHFCYTKQFTGATSRHYSEIASL